MSLLRSYRVGGLITRVIHALPDGGSLVFDSRRQRKRLPPLRFDRSGKRVARAPPDHPWLHLWAVRRLAWWIAILFIIGSACFAVAAAASCWPGSFPAWSGDTSRINTVFFVGSLFFTGAAWLQLLESINGDIVDADPLGETRRRWRWLAWKPHNSGYLASLIQFAGTLLFNLNTADAMLPRLDWLEQDILIWTPDLVGSVCFLAAGYLAWIEVAHDFWSFEPRLIGWWIAIVNLAGCIAFQLSAFTAFYTPQGGDGELAWWSILLTFAGSCCFLAGSYLMIPELFGAGAEPDTSGAGELQAEER